MGDKFFHWWGGGDGAGGNASNGSGNASDGERQMKLHSRASHLPPAVRPSSELAEDRYWTSAGAGGGDSCLKWQQTTWSPASQVLSSLDTFLKVRESGPCFYGIYSLVWIELNLKARNCLETLVIHRFGPLSW